MQNQGDFSTTVKTAGAEVKNLFNNRATRAVVDTGGHALAATFNWASGHTMLDRNGVNYDTGARVMTGIGGAVLGSSAVLPVAVGLTANLPAVAACTIALGSVGVVSTLALRLHATYLVAKKNHQQKLAVKRAAAPKGP